MNFCAITKKSSMMRGAYSNRTRATQYNPCGKSRSYPNMQKKRVFVPELKKYVTIKVSARGLKTIQKNGAYMTLKKAGVI
ncbi:MAG: hypothetical protein A3C08_02910 [Candidatus Taylorbacteria bacterium RIFCSPHIGHO2_02_FULL_47_18]|uniref:50S ribosomal protein L28 n=1 Tax=Candidatus Taylorbacteria bacterium RIFCSPLOWO2_01_FULL_48_100 TaxID=1802322 RepID=A0A1G2NG87_9BACT|nr:MAG: hypothetical protein A2670_02235 [Candidatus Taylorbacteria bacterium RIFCSPHIGHO2_01_FULL_48_38]OHA27687.1 MAG: hypothetical protein A3C08_02910 [Candidatus Taylorbacteria bacterium RIFCSPHIGHO2_02_FULL_47_18]OHA35107.1 MAG: hypothetical protein A2938_01680 [Candidatus Taylorbacteria bacterium RIFCSPLOWO2_01_FULL_48_100]OHA41021.1 MAG: hypothetical protein A3J31_02930 [Candidatus Taylorbacteria bacterium RIFCSPLOWO2_02_FULL_48_16]